MWIMSKDRKTIVNTEHVNRIYREDNTIYCDNFAIAQYDNLDTTRKTLLHILNAIDDELKTFYL